MERIGVSRFRRRGPVFKRFFIVLNQKGRIPLCIQGGSVRFREGEAERARQREAQKHRKTFFHGTSSFVFYVPKESR